ncbi:2Fe-2S iron-sulfur cluster-binding protein [Limnobacter sp.]|uniref:2Fe-2S iron-sulfur cluster-binding protein n=1 Tax=Limnobacter sp. TaxID=2003368 RepID=UPI00273407B6|nr:2Fe-2S iron-sulfur cluster-binding protein [Limnobacter sp.]MDP3187827.1 2Fe-2S iron-sulfur cluster-binding protein [Limnobacter sp.]
MTQIRITTVGREFTFNQSVQDTVLRAALRAGVGFPYECNSGGCGSCKFDLLDGTVEHLWSDAPGLTDRDRRKGRLLACQCRASTDLCIKVRIAPEFVPIVTPERFRAKFISMHDITHDIREFRFVTEGRANFLAGQYAMLEIPGICSPRAYSMSNVGNEEGEWHFQIRRVAGGVATAKLFHDLHAGDEIEIDGPYGLAYLRDGVARDIVCVAGGSGLAPMVSIARGAAQSGLLKTRKLHFFYGGRTARDICGEVFLRELEGYGDRIHFYPVVSLPSDGEGSHWRGETGFVHELVRRIFDDHLPGFEFYFAGPPAMTQTLQEMLMVDHHVPFEQIHFDRFF